MDEFEKYDHDHFLTTYGRDYTRKECEVKRYNAGEQEFKDPLIEPFKDYLTINVKAKNKNGGDPYETIQEYFERFKINHPKCTKRYFDEGGINLEDIKTDQFNSGRTVYRVDYSNRDNELSDARLLHFEITLPENCQLPLTSYLNAYRNPKLINENALQRAAPIIHSENLSAENKVKEKIQKITTGETVYQKSHGVLGARIIEDQIYGKIVHPPCTCLAHKIK